MTSLRSILSLALLLASSGALLTASQVKITVPATTDVTCSLPVEKEAKEIASYAKSTERSKKLTALLYDLLPTMPLDLIKIVAGYDSAFAGKYIANIPATDRVGALAVFPDGTIVIGTPSTVSILKPLSNEAQQTSWKPLHTFKMNYCIHALAILDDKRLAVGSVKELAIYTKNGALVRNISFHEDQLTCLAVLPNNRLASGACDKKIKIWNLTTGKCERELTGHTYAIFSLCALPGNLLASGSEDNTIRIWDPTKRSGKECIKTLIGHNDYVDSLIALSNNKIASISHDNTIRIWNISTMKEERAFTATGGYCSLALLPDGTIVSSGSFDKTIRRWDLTKPIGKECIGVLPGHNDTVRSLAILPDGKLVSGSNDKTIKVWE